jgi:hypothetical protein
MLCNILFYIRHLYSFLSGIIDWEAKDKTLVDIFTEEANKSFRFIGVFFFGFIGTLDLIIKAIILIKKPRKIYFKNDIIIADKYGGNELSQIKLNEIYKIKRSFYPIFGTGNTNLLWKQLLLAPLIIFLLVLPNILICIFMQIFFIVTRKIFRKNNIRTLFFPYIILFSNQTNKVLNVSLIDKNVYQDIHLYFFEKLRIDIEHTKTNLKFTNFPKLEG